MREKEIGDEDYREKSSWLYLMFELTGNVSLWVVWKASLCAIWVSFFEMEEQYLILRCLITKLTGFLKHNQTCITVFSLDFLFETIT